MAPREKFGNLSTDSGLLGCGCHDWAPFPGRDLLPALFTVWCLPVSSAVRQECGTFHRVSLAREKYAKSFNKIIGLLSRPQRFSKGSYLLPFTRFPGSRFLIPDTRPSTLFSRRQYPGGKGSRRTDEHKPGPGDRSKFDDCQHGY